jgi:hypothetical protein
MSFFGAGSIRRPAASGCASELRIDKVATAADRWERIQIPTPTPMNILRNKWVILAAVAIVSYYLGKQSATNA